MPDQATLSTLQSARALLETSYIKFEQDNGIGGHCALGCIAFVLGRRHAFHDQDDAAEAIGLLNNTAEALHPEINHHTWANPIVQVNNSTDKETTLAVFDAAILGLQIKLESAKEENQVQEPVYA